jgi:Tfp pilus assembly protein PilO
MKWLPREKRNPFIIVVLITAVVLALICFGLIGSQKDTLIRAAASRNDARSKLQDIENTIKNADATEKDLQDVTYQLSRAEEDMASGDLFSWTVNTMGLFKKQYKVEIPEVGRPTEGPVDLLPAFPYQQIRFSINGKAFYHDLGKFIADFENNFPHARVVNLIIDSNGGDGEKLSFRMEIIVLVKPT